MMNCRSVGILIAALMLWATQVSSGEPPVLKVIRPGSAPEIDGELSEACWRGAPSVTDFRLVKPRGKTPTQRTEAWVAADGDALYLAFRCTDDRMDMVPAEVTGPDGHVWKDDCIEVFLMPHGPYYYHFGANLIGTRYDARIDTRIARRDQKPVAWHADWKSAARRGADHWTMEIAIPFACLDLGAEVCAKPIRINVGREQRRLTEFSCWPAGGFHNFKEYAFLDGLNLDVRRYGLALGQLNMGRRRAGTNRFTAVVAEEPVAGAETVLRARIRHSAHEKEHAVRKVFRSEKGRAIALAYDVPFDPGHATIVVECLGEHGAVRASRTDVFRVPAVLEARLDLPVAYRSDGAVWLRGSALLEEALLATAQLQVTLLSGEEGAARCDASLDRKSGAIAASIAVSNLKPGRYQVEVRLSVPGLRKEAFMRRFPLRVLRGPVE